MEAVCLYIFFNFLEVKNIDMSTKTLGWLVRAKNGKKLGSGWDLVNSFPTLSQPGRSKVLPRLTLVVFKRPYA